MESNPKPPSLNPQTSSAWRCCRRESFTPFELDTGLGCAVLRAARAKGAKQILLGIGGSATNDGGFGLARALGWHFLRANKTRIARWTELADLSSVQPPERPVLFDDLTVAVDVRNPLLGPTGCSRVYGPQKGLVDFDLAERALGRLAAVIAEHTHVSWEIRNPDREPREAWASACSSSPEPGWRWASTCSSATRCSRIASAPRSSSSRAKSAIDAQSLMGKGVGEIATLCGTLGVPCIGIAGAILERMRAQTMFRALYALTPDLTDQASALRDAASWLERCGSATSRPDAGNRSSRGRRPGTDFRLCLRVASGPSSALTPRAMAAVSLPAWKQVKSGRSRQANGPHSRLPALMVGVMDDVDRALVVGRSLLEAREVAEIAAGREDRRHAGNLRDRVSVLQALEGLDHQNQHDVVVDRLAVAARHAAPHVGPNARPPPLLRRPSGGK